MQYEYFYLIFFNLKSSKTGSITIVLLFVGIEEIIVGIYAIGKSRWTNIELGVVVVVLAI